MDRDSRRRNRQLEIGNWKLGLCAVGCLLACGCSAPRRTFAPPVDPGTLDDSAFLHYLAGVPAVTVDEGFRAVLLLDVDKVEAPTFRDRVGVLIDRGAVKAAWGLDADQTLDHGTLAHILTVVCETPRSVSESLASRAGWGDRRYALKTCVAEGLLPYALPHNAVTGGELMAALTRAEACLKTRSGDEEP